MTASQPLRLVFAGTPQFAATALEHLLKSQHSVVAVYCQPDRPSGRGKKIQPCAVKQLALEWQIPVEQPTNFKQQQTVEKLASYQADLMVVVAYGLLLPASVLNTPLFGCINIHASLLPRWRGAAPIQRAIEKGDQQTGITLMQMDQGLDTGNILAQQTCQIESTDTSASLHDKLAIIGGRSIMQYLNDFPTEYRGEPQSADQASYAEKLSKAEAAINWALDAAVIDRKIRAFNPWPVCFSLVGKHRLRVWQSRLTENVSTKTSGSIVSLSSEGIGVVCGDKKIILLTILQADNSKAMQARDLLNSRKNWFEENPQFCNPQPDESTQFC